MSLTGGTLQSTCSYKHTGVYAAGGELRPRTANESSPAGFTSLAFTYGTGSGKVNAVGFVERTLSAAAADTLDLSAGTFGSGASVKDVFGTVVALTKIKYIHVVVIAGTGSGLVVGNAASNAHQLWHGGDTHTTAVTNGGVPFVQGDAAGKTVDSSNKNVLLTNADGANGLTYRLTVAGEA